MEVKLNDRLNVLRAGIRLGEIKAQGLYRFRFASFDRYLWERWGIRFSPPESSDIPDRPR